MKAAILFEMTLLYGGAILSKKQNTDWQTLFLSGVLTKSAVAVAILLALLLTMEELGAGSVAVTFGALIVLGYFLAGAGALGQTILNAEQSFFGVTTPPPTSLEGPSTQQANQAKAGY